MNEKVRIKALSTLDGIEQIVRNERTVRGTYIDQNVDPEFSGAICHGHRACLLGSAWLAYGVKPRISPWDRVDLPGVETGKRREFLRNRPALKAVYKALNSAATRKVVRDPELCRSYFDDNQTKAEFIAATPVDGEWSLAEDLFEDGTLSSRNDLLRLIRSARREIETL